MDWQGSILAVGSGSAPNPLFLSTVGGEMYKKENFLYKENQVIAILKQANQLIIASCKTKKIYVHSYK
jgi:hypothetical protein